MRNIIAVVITLSLVMSFVSNAEAADSSLGRMKYGWVDLKEVMKEYYKTEEMLEQFEKEKAKKESEIKQLVEEIEKMEAELLLLNEKARLAKEEDIIRKKIATNRMIEEAEQELSAQSIIKQGKLLEDIIKVTEDLATREGYTFIFRAEGLLYKDPALDCTDRIITELNKGKGEQRRLR